MTSVFDRVWGTKSFTPGAELQLPRKVPMRVEPKSYFANERTFLSWVSMAVTMGGVSSALLGMTAANPNPKQGDGTPVISRKTVDAITCVYVPLSILILFYALFTYEWRSRFMHKKQIGFFDDKIGPVAIAVLVFLSLLGITILGFVDYLGFF